MKQKFTLSWLALTMTLLLFGGGIKSWGTDVTFTSGTEKGSNGTSGKPDSMTKEGITISGTNFATTTAQYRIYSGSTLTISSSLGNISKITFVADASNNYDFSKMSIASGGTGTFTSSSAKGGTSTWTGNASSVSFSLSAQCRAASITVTYTPSKTTGTISVTPTSKTDLAIGGQFTITPSSNNTEDATYTWTSSDETVAKVSGGVVTGVAAGNATITATLVAGAYFTGGATATCNVTVVDGRTPVGSMTAITPSSLYVGEMGEFTLTKSMTGAVASYTWESSDDTKLELADEMYEAKDAGAVTVTVTATPTDEETYRPVTSDPFNVTITYKYSAPTISKSSGDGNSFTTSTNVTLGTVSGAAVYFTTDGTTPTSSSTAYSSPFAITATTTIKAVAIDGDGLVSPVSTATYTKEPAIKANITLAAGQTLTFGDFTGLGGAYASAPASPNFLASDGDKYTWSQSNCITSTKQLQMKNSSGTITSGTITSPNGFNLNLTFSGTAPSVSAASTTQTATSSTSTSATYSISSTSTTITISAGSGTGYISNITFTAKKAANAITATTAYTIDRNNDEDKVTLDATATSGTVNYAVKSSSLDEGDYVFDEETGELLVTGTTSGTIVITASSPETSTYYAATPVDITITVVGERADATISVNDDNVTYGSNYVVDCSSFACGNVTSVSSSNTSVATVAYVGNIVTVTPVAVGSTDVTINTAISDLYKAGSKTFKLTVDAPTGEATAGKGSSSTADLDFTDNTDWGFPTDDYTTVKNTYNDGTYSITLNATSNGYRFNASDNYLIMGKKGATLTFQEFDKYVTRIDVVGRSGASGKVTQNIYVGETEVSTSTTGATGTNTYNINENYQAPGNVYVLKVTNDNNTQITGIKLYFTDVLTESVTVAASGYGTFCSEYPLDLDELDSKVKAYIVTDVSSTTVTFSQITGKIKGGVPFILYGTAGTYSIPSASSSTVPEGNLLHGTLAPEYITTVSGDYTNFGLSGGEFVKINSGTVPAHKAFLPVLTENLPSSGKLNIVFNDETAIRTIENGSKADVWYDLQGRRVMNPTRGLYIHNGKKVVKQ